MTGLRQPAKLSKQQAQSIFFALNQTKGRKIRIKIDLFIISKRGEFFMILEKSIDFCLRNKAGHELIWP